MSLRRTLPLDLCCDDVGGPSNHARPQIFSVVVAAWAGSSHTCDAMQNISANTPSAPTPFPLSIVVPVTTVSPMFTDLLGALEDTDCEVIVVQAHSPAVGAGQPEPLTDNLKWIFASPSRGGQIARGIEHARGDVIWVLHADSTGVDQALGYLKALAKSGQPVWGRFDVQLLGHHAGLVWVARMMNWRSRFTRICTGDQGMFFHRSALVQVGGYPSQRLMEDIEISKKLRRKGQFLAPNIRISTSGERWERDGILRTITRMWRWRLRYFFGASADELYDEYYGNQSGGRP